jgi:membrane protease subunit HflC
MPKTSIILFVLLLLGVAASGVVVIDETETAIITQFGEYKRTVSEPGLHFKAPLVQTVQRMERRIMGSDNPPSSYLTRDKKRLVVDPVTRYRIVDPLKFFTTVHDEAGAKARLDDLINSELRRELASRDFGEIICAPKDTSGVDASDEDIDAQFPDAPTDAGAAAPVDGAPAPADSAVPPGGSAVPSGASAAPQGSAVPAGSVAAPSGAPSAPRAGGAPNPSIGGKPEPRCERGLLLVDVTRKVQGQAAEFGINVVDVRIKRADLPTEVQESVFQRMRAERARVAQRYRSQGEEEAKKIRADTDKRERILLAQAYAEAQKLRGEGDAESTRVYADAYGRDPDFYAFVRSLETYERVIGPEATLVLSTGSPFFKFLESPGALDAR